MRLALNQSFTPVERQYLNKYLVRINLNHITIGQKTLKKFLKRMWDQNDDDELNFEGKTTLATKILSCIMQNEEVFINIIMEESPFLLFLSKYPYCDKNIIKGVILKVAFILENNKTVREKYIRDTSDINILSDMRPVYARSILDVLIKTNDIGRLIKTNEELCRHIKQNPKLHSFYIVASLNILFNSKDDFTHLQETLTDFNISLPPKIEKLIKGKICISTSQ